MMFAHRHTAARAGANAPLHTLSAPTVTPPAAPATRRQRARRWMLGAAIVLILATSFGVGGLVQQRRARAYAGLPVVSLFGLTDYLNRLLDEADQITVDQIRKIVAQEITRKVVEKIIYGGNGGVGIGGAFGTSGNGAAAFINDYARYLYLAPADDARRYVDTAYDKYLPSYIDPQTKQLVRQQFDPSYNPIPTNCVDPGTIDYNNDPQASEKITQSLQPGCNDVTAAAILYDLTAEKFAEYTRAAQTEAEANKGLVSKDEKTNKLKQSGAVYEGIVQGAINGVYQMQNNNQSAISSIIGALVDQMVDELLSQTAQP